MAEQAEEMCKNGICRHITSQWASDVVIVRKKDSTMRFVIDYQRLNTITNMDAYELTNPATILDKLEGSKFLLF